MRFWVVFVAFPWDGSGFSRGPARIGLSFIFLSSLVSGAPAWCVTCAFFRGVRGIVLLGTGVAFRGIVLLGVGVVGEVRVFVCGL